MIDKWSADDVSNLDLGKARRSIRAAYWKELQPLAADLYARICRGEFDDPRVSYEWMLARAIEVHPRFAVPELRREVLMCSDHADRPWEALAWMDTDTEDLSGLPLVTQLACMAMYDDVNSMVEERLGGVPPLDAIDDRRDSQR